MPWEQFLDLTPKEFFSALQEKEDHESNVAFDQVKTICQTIRMQTLLLVNGQRKRPLRNVKKLWIFSWEKEDITPPQTKEEMVSMMKAIANYHKNKKDKTKKNHAHRSRNIRR